MENNQKLSRLADMYTQCSLSYLLKQKEAELIAILEKFGSKK